MRESASQARRVVACGFALSASLCASAAAAQQRGFAIDRFEPSERGSEWFALDSLDMRGHLRFAAGVVGEYAHDALVARSGDDTRASILQHQLYVHPGASLVLFDRFRLALSLPIAAYQTGDGIVANGVGYAAPSANVGDLRLSGDVRLFGQHGGPITGALGVVVHFPTGSRNDYTSDGYVRVGPRATIAGDVSYFTYSARVGFEYRALDERFQQNALGSEITLAGAAGVRILDGKLVVGPEVFASSVVNDGSFFEKRSTPVEWLGGAHYSWNDLRFGAGAGTGLARGWGSPSARVFLSAEWAPAFHEKSPPPLVLPTAPPPPPEEPPADRDHDGVVDVADACPDLPGPKSDDMARNGCPPDRDGDGILDDVDACPDQAGAKSEDPTENGCPSDRDGDGVPDIEDACPDAPGPGDPDPHRNGCPLARIEDGQVKIVDQIRFATNSSQILRESDPTLLAVATTLKSHPEITKVRVEGYTDSTGKDDKNRELSYLRAHAVETWLVTSGIAAARVESKGYGSVRPISTNETPEGRQLNRRVEIRIAEQRKK